MISRCISGYGTRERQSCSHELSQRTKAEVFVPLHVRFWVVMLHIRVKVAENH